jgi:hypothetical protein
MGIGAGIFLIAIGLILAVAVDASVAGIDIQVAGWILAAVGAVGVLLSLTVWRAQSTTVVEQRRTDDTAPPL